MTDIEAAGRVQTPHVWDAVVISLQSSVAAARHPVSSLALTASQGASEPESATGGKLRLPKELAIPIRTDDRHCD
jgi:hypothetical protein